MTARLLAQKVKVTSTMIRERLLAEAEVNVAITFAESENRDSFEIGGAANFSLACLSKQCGARDLR